jgi:nicotinate-nucleotide pyrophosphorylase (carboxylating)
MTILGNGTGVTGLTPRTVRALEEAGLEVPDVVRVVRAALDEDFRYGVDVTSAATVAGRTVVADVVAREAGVVAGLPVALAVLDLLGEYLSSGASEAGAGGNAAAPAAREAVAAMMRDTSGPPGGTLYPTSLAEGLQGAGKGGLPGAGAGARQAADAALVTDGLTAADDAALVTDGLSVTGTALVTDGARVLPGDAVLRVSGDAVAVLGAERTVLNFLTHLSGIASGTWAWASAVAGTGAVVRDTRKTLPGLRGLQKYAVRCGGGENHRMGLGDAALVKDNHVAAAGGVAAAVHAVRSAARPGLVIEVECDSVAQVREALTAGARFILLDNMPVPVLREAVAVARAYDGVRLEASGGLQLGNAREVASTGVDYLSIGGLTHSSRVLDLGLDYLGGEG